MSRSNCSKATRPGIESFKVHIDGCNILPYLLGEADESPRNFFFYTDDDGKITALHQRRGPVELSAH